MGRGCVQGDEEVWTDDAKSTLPALNKGSATSAGVGELSFAEDVRKVDEASDGGGAREAEVRGRVNFRTFSFPHAHKLKDHPHLHKVAEEANGQLMAEMTRAPAGAPGPPSVSTMVQGLESMSGTQMIHTVLAEMEAPAETE